MKKKLTSFTLTLLSIILILGLADTVLGCTKEDFDKAVLADSVRQLIYIGSDGSIDPAAAPIQRNGNTYTFTDDVYAPIVVDKEGIVIDGAGYTLQGSYNGTRTDLPIFFQGTGQTSGNSTIARWSVGIDLAKGTIQNLTVKNLNIKNFSIGIWLWTSNNTVTGNAITENILGILLSASGNDITGNYIANNEQGIFFGANEPGNIPTNTTLSQNCFISNLMQLSGCICVEYNETEDIHTWDDGQSGNYWSDYSGIDANGDGLGDTPYVIDVLNKDRYPLMQIPVTPPTPAPKTPVELIVIIGAFSTIAAVAVIGSKRKRR